MNKLQLGQAAELKASHFLQTQGLHLLIKNYRCPYGEIDLIMQDKEDIVFVEVRSRSRIDYGTATESVNFNKINKIVKTATHFLQAKHWLYKKNSRFDVIAIHPVGGQLELEWVKNAFSEVIASYE